jgi:hypothetical protein
MMQSTSATLAFVMQAQPDYECFDVCQNPRGSHIGASLHSLIIAGAGRPNSSPGERHQEPRASWP